MRTVLKEFNPNPLNKSIKIILNYFLGPALFIWVGLSVYKQICLQPDIRGQLVGIRNAATGSEAWKLWTVFLLMFVNWGLEARKWQVMLFKLDRMSFFRSFRAILSGVAFSMNTPNRIGEYGGRVLFVAPEKRFRAVSLTAAGSFSQLIVTICMGAVGLFFIADKVAASSGMEHVRIWLTALKIGMIFLAIGVLVFYFRMNWLIAAISRIPFAGRILKHIEVIREMDPSILLRGLSISLFRFLVFIIQYNLMLQLMDVELGWWQGFWTVSVLFLLLAAVPTIALLELGLRWEYSIVLFSLFSTNSVGMYAAATGIWVINLVIPALTGSMFMLSFRLFKGRFC